MAMINLNLGDIEASNDFSPIPAGEYPVRVVDSSIFQSKAGNQCAKFVLEVIGDQYAGRKIFENFTLTHEIGKKMFKTMLFAGGFPNPDFINDTQDAHGLEMMAKVVIEESDKYDPANKIKGYKKIKRAAAPKQAAPPNQKQTSAPSEGMPWS